MHGGGGEFLARGRTEPRHRWRVLYTPCTATTTVSSGTDYDRAPPVIFIVAYFKWAVVAVYRALLLTLRVL